MVGLSSEVGRFGWYTTAAVNRIGAVSPAARSRPKITPVVIPESAWGRTMRRIVCQRVPPNEMLTTRNALGTVRRASSEALIITGSVMIPNVSPPAMTLTPNFMKITKAPSPNKPYTTDGIPARLMMAIRMLRVQPVICGVLGEVDGCAYPDGYGKQGSHKCEQHRAQNRRVYPSRFQSVGWEAGDKFPGDRGYALNYDITQNEQDRQHRQYGNQGHHGEPKPLHGFPLADPDIHCFHDRIRSDRLRWRNMNAEATRLITREIKNSKMPIKKST